MKQFITNVNHYGLFITCFNATCAEPPTYNNVLFEVQYPKRKLIDVIRFKRYVLLKPETEPSTD